MTENISLNFPLLFIIIPIDFNDKTALKQTLAYILLVAY